MHSLLHRDLPQLPWFPSLSVPFVNIALDPVFIFLFFICERQCCTTVLSQAISTLWVVSFLLVAKDTASPGEKVYGPGAKSLSSMYRAGTCYFIMQSSESIVTLLLQLIPASVRR